jgi:hypothetical protein
MSDRDIIHRLRQVYGTELSASTVSAITDAVLEAVKAWQSRPLDPVYAVVFLDAIVVKARDSQVVQNKPAYIAIGAGADGLAGFRRRDHGGLPVHGRATVRRALRRPRGYADLAAGAAGGGLMVG